MSKNHEELDEKVLKDFQAFWDKPLETIIQDIVNSGSAAACDELRERIEVGLREDKEIIIKQCALIEKELESLSIQNKTNKQLLLGIYYADVINDYLKALFYLNAANTANNSTAKCYLGIFLIEGLDPVKQDKKKAKEFFEAAATNNDAFALQQLGSIYLLGLGEIKNYTKAFQHLTRASDGGNSQAMAALGYMFQRGVGVNIDHNEATKWYKQSASKGCVTAMQQLGDMHLNHHQLQTWPLSDNSNIPSYSFAVKCFKLAAEKGSPEALRQLGTCYEHGNGVKRNIAKAAYCYRKAVEAGDTVSENMLYDLYSKHKKNPAAIYHATIVLPYHYALYNSFNKLAKNHSTEFEKLLNENPDDWQRVMAILKPQKGDHLHDVLHDYAVKRKATVDKGLTEVIQLNQALLEKNKNLHTLSGVALRQSKNKFWPGSDDGKKSSPAPTNSAPHKQRKV